MRFVITDRVVNGSPVWAAMGGELFMYKALYSDIGGGMTTVGSKNDCVEGSSSGHIHNR
jgi:hypothetical protein